jgi:hypothetical protein
MVLENSIPWRKSYHAPKPAIHHKSVGLTG